VDVNRYTFINLHGLADISAKGENHENICYFRTKFKSRARSPERADEGIGPYILREIEMVITISI